MTDPVQGSTRAGWEDLHRQTRFRPRYPSESVVRFLARSWGLTGPRDAASPLIVDIGCGAGRHLPVAAEVGGSVVGVDMSSTGLGHARSAVAGRDVPVVTASMFELPLKSGSADGAISYGAFLYADRPGFARAVGELHRILRPGGRALVVTRTTDDSRFGAGDRVDDCSFVLTTNDTNELGMLMHFLAGDDIPQVFGAFSEVTVDRIDHTDLGGTIRNSDWVIEVQR